ncbi:MAG: hypothetical protein ACOH2H_14170 [Cypionkella sp.]
MRRLTLHIGSHKTGTSTLQVTLRENEALLFGRGLGVARVAPWPHVHPFLGFVDRNEIFPAGYKVNDPEAFASFLGGQKAEHALASSENFSFFFQQSAVDDLAAALKPLFDEIRIVVYLRRQDRHAVSHHQEGAKPDRSPEGLLWGHSLNALPDPTPQQRLYLDYNHRIAMWEKAFGSDNLSVRVFDRTLLNNGDIVSDMLSLIGVADDGLVRLPDRNVSLGRLQAKVGHIANEVLGDDRVTQRLLDALPASDDRMIPSAAAARTFLEPYREGNRRLNDRLAVTPFPDLFPDDFSDYPETASEEMSEADCSTALQAVVRTLAPKKTPVNAMTADDLRMAAVAMRKVDPDVALRLIRAAHSLRPEGPAIQKLLADLEARLNKPESA